MVLDSRQELGSANPGGDRLPTICVYSGPVGAGVGGGVLSGPLVEVLSQVVSQSTTVGMVGFANQDYRDARIATGKALGGYSGKVCEVLSDHDPVLLKRLGVDGLVICSGESGDSDADGIMA